MTTLAATVRPFQWDSSGGDIGDASVRRSLQRIDRVLRLHARERALDWDAATEGQLEELVATCGSPDWDGEGSLPITRAAARQARRLLALLQPLTRPGTPPPVAVPESDGEISLDWETPSGKLVSISIGEAGVANFASRLQGGDEFHGRVRLDQGVTEAVRRLAALVSDF